ncbi:hypothetical protein [Amycolatopsis thailandensis]|uniref:hypothetical protein n=1 Tax=Amycolatopsis thailandensis TaxID=589330 RepID=UPI003640B983
MARSQRRRGPDRIDPAANQDRTRDRRRRASHGLLAERLPGCQEIASLYAVGVGERRERLVERWDPIHEWLGATLTVIGSAVMDQGRARSWSRSRRTRCHRSWRCS